MKSFADLQSEAWNLAENKGFHEGREGDGRDDTLVRLCLIHTEVSEAAQEVKRFWDDTGCPTSEAREVFAFELADIVIRVMDCAECVGIDLQWFIETKMAECRERPKMYGTAKAEEVQS